MNLKERKRETKGFMHLVLSEWGAASSDHQVPVHMTDLKSSSFPLMGVLVMFKVAAALL